MSVGDCIPEKTILLDLDPAAGFERVRSSRPGRDRMESEGLEFHKKVWQAYRRLASEEPGRFLVVDGSGKPGALASQIRQELAPLLGELPEVALSAGESGS
jgi:dTMP kinase